MRELFARLVDWFKRERLEHKLADAGGARCWASQPASCPPGARRVSSRYRRSRRSSAIE